MIVRPGGEHLRVAVLANLGPATTSVYTALGKSGHEVHLFTFHDKILELIGTQDDITDLHLHFLPRHLKWKPLTLARELLRALKKLCPDIWHAHIAIPYGIAGALAGWHPFFLSTHGSDVYFRAWMLKSNRLRLMLPPGVDRLTFRLTHAALAAIADGVVVYSPDMLEWLPRLGYPRDKLIPCFLGIDTRLFRPAERQARTKAEFRIICSRNLEPIYDHETLFAATAQLRKQGIPVRLLLAGGGSSQQRLEKIAAELGIRDCVDFLGVVPHRQLPPLLASSDVLASTALSDTTAMSVLEGMACGLPVVVTNVGSLSRRVINGTNGFVFEPGDVESLAGYLTALADNEEMRYRMGELNAERALREFDLRSTVERLEQIYEDAKVHKVGPTRVDTLL